MQREKRDVYDDVETAHFRELSATIESLKENIKHMREDLGQRNQLKNKADKVFKGQFRCW